MRAIPLAAVHYGDPLLLEHVATGLRVCVGPPSPWLGRSPMIANKDGGALKMERYRDWREEAGLSGAINKGTPVRLIHKETEGKLGGEDVTAHLYRESKQAPPTSCCLWELLWTDEATGETIHDGGACRWTETFKLLHLPTGQLLATAEEEGSDGASLRLVQDDAYGTQNGVLWQLMPLYATDALLISTDQFFFLRHLSTGLWLHVTVTRDHLSHLPGLHSASGELERLDVVLSKVRHDEDVFGFVAVPRQQAEDVIYSRCCLARFESFATQFGGLAPSPSERPLLMAPPGGAGANAKSELEWEDAIQTLQALIAWLESDTAACPQRQKLLREQGALDAAVAVGQLPVSSQKFTLNDLATAEARTLEENQPLHCTMTLSWRLLSIIVRDNTANRLHAVRKGYVPLMQSQLGYSLDVASTLVQVYSENELLLDSVEDETIRTFVELIRAPGGRKARYLAFLLVLCRVGKLTVRTNQWRVCRMLIQEAPELLLVPILPRAGGEIVVRGAPVCFPSLAELAPEFDPTDEWVSSGYLEVPLLRWLERGDEESCGYFEKLLELYALVVQGRNLRNTPHMRKLLPFETVMAVITNKDLNAKHSWLCASFTVCRSDSNPSC
jgi:hypothetical protein